MRRGALVLAITLGATRAAAHVAPSVDDNNRYLKLTPQRDRVRLAYTVFFGEKPGARMRPSLDTDGDGAISDAEARAFGDKLAAEVGAALEVGVDGAAARVAWADVVVGLGSPRVRAGAFSVDLIAYFCLAAPGDRHALRLRDRFRLLRPGETEVRLEALPGVTIETGRVGSADDPRHEYRFVGPGGPLSDAGVELVFVAGAEAPAGGGCTVDAARPADRAWTSLVFVGGGALAGLAVALGTRRRRARGPSGQRP